MKKKRKQELRKMSIEKLKLVLEDLKIPLMIAKQRTKGFGLSPPTGTSTKLVSNLKKEIAIINTFINEKNEHGK